MEHKYKPKEASQYIGRSISTLQRLDYSGKLKAYRTTTNRRYYTKKQLDTFLGKKVQTQRLQIAYKDRFIRFGYDWFNHFCQKHGCDIVVLNNPSLSPEEELIQDLLTILLMK